MAVGFDEVFNRASRTTAGSAVQNMIVSVARVLAGAVDADCSD